MSAVIVAGGVSKRFGQDKGLIRLADKPLVLHVLDKIVTVVDEVVVVVNSEMQKKKFAEVINQRAYIVVDNADVQTPLVGASSGFETVHHEYTLLLACDIPFLSSNMLSFLLDVCSNKTAAIPRWPNGNIEPLHAAYHARTAARAAKKALKDGKLDMHSMVTNMQNLRYVSTSVLQQLDSKLITFFNINSLEDLKKAESTIKHHAH